MTINNSGEESLTNFMLRDEIPQFTTYVDNTIASSNSTSIMKVENGVAEWTIDEIPAKSKPLYNLQLTFKK
ncbi:hypothetical protein MGH68_02020 [Erysipelothrix sp. D19-032]